MRLMMMMTMLSYLFVVLHLLYLLPHHAAVQMGHDISK